MQDNEQILRKEFKTKLRDIYIAMFPICGNCGGKGSHVHHIIPLSLGGTNRFSNLVTLCDNCHGIVHNKDFNNWKYLQKKGIKKAKAQGKYKGGKKRIKMPINFEEEYNKWKLGQQTAKVTMENCLLKRTTFYAMVKEYEINFRKEHL